MTSSPTTEAPPAYTWGAGVRMLRGLAEPPLTQAQLAARARTSQSRISEIENGSHAVADALRVRIARALKVDPHDLFPYVDGDAAAVR